ncbi:MAG: BrnT family toxin [Planctomycetes bacterium]|jgi:hypothetical protein|nr:BrnT family toxin [Planctomycetota bacterium]
MVRVEWDPVKDAVNRRKHQVSFEEAAGLFSSKRPWLDLDDEAHSDDEIRYLAIGEVNCGVLVVVYTEREGDIVRIISARRATPRERRLHEAWIGRYL